MNKLKFFITGSSGYIGKAICSQIIDENHEVIGFDLLDSDLQRSRYHHIKGYMNEKSKLMEALDNCNCIIHSAVFRGDYDTNLNTAFESNVFGTFLLYECIRKLNDAKVILLSSAPVDKGAPLNNPLLWKSHSREDHAYDLTKRLQEEIAKDYSETFNLSTIILRLGHIVDGKNGVDLEGNSLKNLKYCLGGWVDYHDVVSACLLASKYKGSNFEIFNVIGSHQKEDPFDTNRTIEKLRWKPVYSFREYKE